jgi:hypothetical protein
LIALTQEYGTQRTFLYYPSIMLFGLLTFEHLNKISQHSDQRNAFGLLDVNWFSHMTNLLLIEKVASKGATKREKFHGAYRMLYNGRWVGTEKPAPSVKYTMRRRSTRVSESIKRSSGELIHVPVVSDRKEIASFEGQRSSAERQSHYYFLLARLLTAILTGTTPYLYKTCLYLPDLCSWSCGAEAACTTYCLNFTLRGSLSPTIFSQTTAVTHSFTQPCPSFPSSSSASMNPKTGRPSTAIFSPHSQSPISGRNSGTKSFIERMQISLPLPHRR